jgi:hypothetical protein
LLSTQDTVVSQIENASSLPLLKLLSNL